MAAQAAVGIVQNASSARLSAEDADTELQDSAEVTLPDTQCGLCSWQPSWLQRFASKKMFVLVLGLVGLAAQSVNAYATATLTTMEKRFKIPSKTSGLIASFWDVGELTSLLALGYLGGRSHKPRLIASGAALMAASCLVRLLVHAVYGPGRDALALTKEFGGAAAAAANRTDHVDAVLCGSIRSKYDENDCAVGEESFSVPAVILVMTTILFGIGTSTYLTLGLTYIDDNTYKSKSPIALAVSMCIRLMGPALGYAFASYALALYVQPGVTPLIGNDDPRWIGAWWLGWAPAAGLLLLFAALLALFPRRLPRQAQRRARAGAQDPHAALAARSFNDFRDTLIRLFRNPVFALNSFSGVSFALGFTGYGLFMPKYMETQYRQSSSSASFISGAVGLVCSGLGILASGFVASKYRPSARALAAWSVFVEVMDVCGHFSWAFLLCGEQDLHGSAAGDGSWNLTATCNADCGCGLEIKYEPVCSTEASMSYYSPCHAGCVASYAFANGTKIYADCGCSPNGHVILGPCPRECGVNFLLFLATQCVMRFLGASGLAGNTLIQFRCVEEKDKTMSIAVSEFLLAGLAFIPGPILYGMLLDSTCLVWGERCGQPGNCWLYDDQKLRYKLNFIAAGFLFVGLILDVGVWYYSRDLNIYEDNFAEKDEESSRAKRITASSQSLSAE